MIYPYLPLFTTFPQFITQHPIFVKLFAKNFTKKNKNTPVKGCLQNNLFEKYRIFGVAQLTIEM
jgi:hypothetical protein